MRKKTRYTPILKSKAGEFWALQGLSQQTKVLTTPLIELVPPEEKPLQSTVEGQCKKIAASWGTNSRFYLDTSLLHGGSGNPATITMALGSARAVGLRATPVVHAGYSPASRQAIAAAMAIDGRGAILRMLQNNFSQSAIVHSILSDLGHPADAIDFMIDYRGSTMSLNNDVPQIPHLSHWRRLVAASGVFPSSLSQYQGQGWVPVTRGCWQSWLTGVASGTLPRIPCFGDYSIRNWHYSAGRGNPPVSLRYTSDSEWLVRCDGKLHNGDAPNMIGICQNLVARPEFSGPTFSTGDAEINSRATQQVSNPGGATQWIQWAHSHHLEFVAKNQILPLP